MDSRITPGSRLHTLIQAVMPPTLPTIEPPQEAPQQRDVVDVGPRAHAFAPPAAAPAAPAPAPPAAPAAPAPLGFASFAAPRAAAAAPVNNPTVLTMDEPAGQTPAIDERKSPLEQAKDLNVLLLGRITDVSRRSGALTSGEVGDHLALLGWASDKLESLSQQLESQGKKQENEYVESIQKDLGGAIQSFAQMHQGSVNSEQGAQYYRTMTNLQIDQSVMQTNMMMAQRRSDVIGYSIAARGSGVQAGMGAPGMMPGAPGMMPGAPGMMPGQMMPGQMPGQMMPGQMMPGQMMPGQMMPGQMPGQMMPNQSGVMMNIGGPVVGPGSPGWGMQPGMAPLNIGGPVAAPGAGGWGTPYPGAYYGR